MPTKKDIKHQPEDINLNIVYEDEDLLVINKPPNLVLSPVPGNENGTLVNALVHALLQKNYNLSNLNDNSRPGIVHRLDKDTSGILVVAKNNNTHIKLANQFKNHSITRKYKAIVFGEIVNKLRDILKEIRKNRKNEFKQ